METCLTLYWTIFDQIKAAGSQFHAKFAIVEWFDERNWGTFRCWRRNLFPFLPLSICDQFTSDDNHIYVRESLWIFSVQQFEFFFLYCFFSDFSLNFFSVSNRFIVLPQLFNDYFQQRADNLSRSRIINTDKLTEEVNVFDLITAEASFISSDLSYFAIFGNQKPNKFNRTHEIFDKKNLFCLKPAITHCI